MEIIFNKISSSGESGILVGAKAFSEILSRFSSSKMSLTLVTTLAPFLIRSLVPSDCGEKMEPGTAKTSRLNSKAKLAVMSVPLFSSASTTSVPMDSPAIIRFLAGKFPMPA